ncbi:hypothetical protein ACFVUS_06965 [Nocardia sp. NPDC058058]|uniref:hypothetical protein n=1 Tax=Nocardia sp. NPDC058058 TaxID=3346317 RepID=UPI0036D822C8
MSNHLIEDLVESSICVLHEAAGERRLRDHFAALYRFQEGQDCSFTRFRVQDILLEHGFSFRFELPAHPEYDGRRAFFDGVREFTALAEPAEEDRDDDAWLDQGYIDPPYLYCETGTALWRTMIERGAISGSDAAPPRRLRLVEVVREIVDAAAISGDIELIALWHAQGCTALLDDEVWMEPAPEIPALAAIRDVALRTGAVSHPLPEGYRPPQWFIEDDDIESWWAGADESAAID